VGRFAPSPTGPLHLGSLVAALGSWLFARAGGGRWLVRMEDLDTPRVIPGAADDILRTLERFGLTWDGEVVRQSQRTGWYEDALRSLRMNGHVFPCACSRSDLSRTASAPARGDASDTATGAVYPGTCRNGLSPGKAPRAFRFRVAPGTVTFEDRVFGPVAQDLQRSVGDFVVRRADGPYAYQLAVVVDDAAQGVTEVVRGADLLDSTSRQIALQHALSLPAPSYAHLPLVLGGDGTKLGKRDGALPLDTLDDARVRDAFAFALSALGQDPAESAREAARRFDPTRIPREPRRAPG
jgi:glutamyl-Q tRNA(Asp) synthetase